MNIHLLKNTILAFLLTISTTIGIFAADAPKREFRGAWLHVVGPVSYSKMTPRAAREYLIKQLDLLEKAGCNAVIFQVRPSADALYKSDLEPWSSTLTGRRGKAPSEDWDPMQFVIDEAHKRGMEFHAWLNPYRVSLTAGESLDADKRYRNNKDLYMTYNGKVLFDPAYQENRDFICKVVEDIVKRYDVDAIHMDDYFYPYHVGGSFNADTKSYAELGAGRDKGDWRRENVNLLIEQLHKTIKKTKPWVRFGISPFGIWRNAKNDPNGSDTNGLQNYDDLYADILLWDKNGWIDYVAPQLYWELDHKAASSRKLVKWWADNIHNADLYIGQDVKRTMDQRDTQAGRPDELQTKIELSRQTPGVDGNVWWHGYWVTENYRGARERLANDYQSTLALPPAYGDTKHRPDAPRHLKISTDRSGREILSWDAPTHGSKPKETDVVKFVVYELYDGEPRNTDNPETIIAITPSTSVILPDSNGEKRTYMVTAVDRLNRESSPAVK